MWHKSDANLALHKFKAYDVSAHVYILKIHLEYTQTQVNLFYICLPKI